MARSQANVHFGIFEGLQGLGKDAKLLYLCLLVEETVNQAGVGALRVSLWARKLEISVEATEAALAELDRERFALVDRDTEQVLVRTLIRNDGVADVPNVLWAACRAALQLRSPKLRRELAAELRKLPPKPADKINEKTGRTYVYPDPHATADAIDPGPPRGSETHPVSHGASHPEPIGQIPFGTQADPIRTASHADPIDMCSRTPGGGGGGGGGGEEPSVGTNSSSKNTHSRQSASDSKPDGFDDFWAAFPRREGKRKAEQAYAAALKRGAEPAQLLSATRRYAELTRHGEPRFIAHPSTWLNQGRYDDEPDPHAYRPTADGNRPAPEGTSTQRANAFLNLRQGTR